MPREEHASLEMSPTHRHNPTEKSKQTWIRISIFQPLSEEQWLALELMQI
jgi:hypothetical protein